MKKFYFFMLALFATLAVSAENPELYLLGSINSWSASDSYKFTETDGVYTLSLDELSGTFKVTTSDWSTNWGGASDIEIGETYALTSGGSDCSLKDAVKNVTVTFTLASAELKVEGQATKLQNDFYLVGSLNDWSFSDEYKFSTEDYTVYTLTTTISNGDYGFQIAAQGWGERYNVESTELDVNQTYTVTKNKEYNMKFATEPEGEVTLTLDIDALTLTIEQKVDKWANVEAQTVKSYIYSYILNGYSDFYTSEVKFGDNELQVVNFLNSGVNLEVAYDSKSVTSITADSEYWYEDYCGIYTGNPATAFMYPYGNDVKSNEMYFYPAWSSQAIESYNDIVLCIYTYYPVFDEEGNADYDNGTSGYEYFYIYFPEETSVSNIAVDNSNAPIEVFNLNGVRVNSDNLTPGLYIQRQGNQAKKILVK